MSCHGLSDLSFLALLGAAGGLLLLGALGLVLFDQRALPCLAARLRENGAGAGGKAMGPGSSVMLGGFLVLAWFGG